ncbi:BatD family protein [Nitrosophilus alvini]|uniref:BatD family protein n=1 Tax=Nitrosophilus alvini TaxID=2714855 RepID=UPI001909A1FF|nr:BatD family protein [Nitrosophilus alvini]
MRNPGNFLFLITVLALLPLFAEVRVYTDKKEVHAGESVLFVIEASGEKIVFPGIEKIGKYRVETSTISERIIIKNGKTKRVKKLSVVFTPLSDTKIGPFEVKVDGRVEKTDPLKVAVLKDRKRADDVVLQMLADKKSLYKGEGLILTLRLKIKTSANIVDFRYIAPDFKNFWVNDMGKEREYLSGNYLVKEARYILFPQRSGKLDIEPALMKIAVPKTIKDSFGFVIKTPVWRSVTSNSLQFDVKAVPENIKLVGDFKIKTHVDKKKIKRGDPVTFTVKVEGYGNVKDIETIDINIPEASVFADESKSRYMIKNGKVYGVYEKKFSIVSDSDFTIQPLFLKYFDPDAKSIKELKTEEVKVEVIKEVVNGKKEDIESMPVGESRKNYISKFQPKHYIVFIAGVILGVMIGIILKMISKLNKNSFGKKFLFQNEKDILFMLIPYISENKEAEYYAEMLYENIYKGKKNRIPKERIRKLIEKLKLGQNSVKK